MLHSQRQVLDHGHPGAGAGRRVDFEFVHVLFDEDEAQSHAVSGRASRFHSPGDVLNARTVIADCDHQCIVIQLRFKTNYATFVFLPWITALETASDTATLISSI